MKKLIETLKNIWSIEELRKKIIYTLLLLLVYRIGCQILLPGLDPAGIKTLGSNQNGLLGLFNQFAGGAFNNASIFALGIMPYISASIAMQLLQIAVPQFQKLSKDDSGRKKLNNYTRYLTVIITLFQGFAYVSYLRSEVGGAIYNDNFMWQVLVGVTLTAGTLFVMWMGEKITEKGIGNGTSLIITAGIVARLFPSAIQEFSSKFAKGAGSGLLAFLLEFAVLIAIIVGIILLVQGTRRIPLNYARRIVGATSMKDISGARDFLPLKVNSAGVMPIIFAQALLFIPATIAGFKDGGANAFSQALRDPSSIWYNVLYVILVIAFTYFYTALIFNPTQMAEDLKRNNGFIPGVKPGEETAGFIGTVMDRITLPGAVFLALLGILPGIIGKIFVDTQGFASFFGGTSMLIMVGVILDTLQQIESHLLMRHYDGLMETGRITGRQPVANATNA